MLDCAMRSVTPLNGWLRMDRRAFERRRDAPRRLQQSTKGRNPVRCSRRAPATSPTENSLKSTLLSPLWIPLRPQWNLMRVPLSMWVSLWPIRLGVELQRPQVACFHTSADAAHPRIDRVVDLGSGHGHLTRAIARTSSTAEALGVERDPSLVERARELGGTFVHAPGELFALGANDVAVGLHPCGALGDAIIQRARQARAHVLMVSCCYQKVPDAARCWLSERGEAPPLPREVLGLANLAPRSFRGSGDLDAKRDWRRARLAVRLLLQQRGLKLAPGDEGRGVTKERFRAGLKPAANRALERRELGEARDGELAWAAKEAKRLHGVIARLALPRHALARVLELAIVLDRAQYLAEADWKVEVRPLFSAATSPRNLAIIAQAS